MCSLTQDVSDGSFWMSFDDFNLYFAEVNLVRMADDRWTRLTVRVVDHNFHGTALHKPSLQTSEQPSSSRLSSPLAVLPSPSLSHQALDKHRPLSSPLIIPLTNPLAALFIPIRQSSQLSIIPLFSKPYRLSALKQPPKQPFINMPSPQPSTALYLPLSPSSCTLCPLSSPPQPATCLYLPRGCTLAALLTFPCVSGQVEMDGRQRRRRARVHHVAEQLPVAADARQTHTDHLSSNSAHGRAGEAS